METCTTKFQRTVKIWQSLVCTCILVLYGKIQQARSTAYRSTVCLDHKYPQISPEHWQSFYIRNLIRPYTHWMTSYTPVYIVNLCFRLFNIMTEQELIDTRTVPIQCLPAQAVSPKPCRKFRAVIQILILLVSLAQAIPLITESNSPATCSGEERNINSPVEPPQAGDLPICPNVYHRIQIDTSSRQLDMISLYDAPISTASPPDYFPRKYHPVSRKYFLNVSADTPLPTNKCVSLVDFYLCRVFLTLTTQVLHEPVP